MLPPKEYKLLFSGEIPTAAPLSIKFMMLLFNAMFGILADLLVGTLEFFVNAIREAFHLLLLFLVSFFIF